ncbi:hypothetical protein GB937_002746 [Aspergillus fischeri]|nr:hypothetical protein GB937_002746 [Aspergillus fischeri]
MDSYFIQYHEVKKAEVEKDLDGHMRHACFGVYEEHVQRYPKIFRYATSLLVQDDLVLVIENEDSPIERRTMANIISTEQLSVGPGLAVPGEIQRVAGHAAFRGWRVPHYAAKLQKSMNRFLKALTPERPEITMRKLTAWVQHGLRQSRGLTVDEIHLRSERQTSRHLPRSRATLRSAPISSRSAGS